MKKRFAIGFFILASLSGCPGAAPVGSTATPPTVPSAATPATPAVPVATATVAKAEASDFLIVPDKGFGAITADSTEESLKKAFGADQVKREKMYVGDGQEWNGIAVFPSQPEKRVEVFWFEEDPSRVQLIQISGQKSLWKTAQGVTLGTTLKELEKLNGKPFKLLGLGWDFGGGITDWEGGALEGLTLRCDDTAVQLSDKENEAVLGDQEVLSSLPAMQKANPKVSKITVNFALPTSSATP